MTDTDFFFALSRLNTRFFLLYKKKSHLMGEKKAANSSTHMSFTKKELLLVLDTNQSVKFFIYFFPVPIILVCIFFVSVLSKHYISCLRQIGIP